jgi:hypothetical protein
MRFPLLPLIAPAGLRSITIINTYNSAFYSFITPDVFNKSKTVSAPTISVWSNGGAIYGWVLYCLLVVLRFL